jgi:LPXTG-motif cell wall-anchored protein
MQTSSKNIQISTLIGVALIAAGGYLLWKESQKEKKGIDGFTTKVIGNRTKRGFAGNNLPVRKSPF